MIGIKKHVLKLSVVYHVAIALTLLTSCDELIEFSPYDADVDKTEINIKNSRLIEEITRNSDTVVFALISDNHTHYDELEEALDILNSNDSVQFIVNCGDITDCGLTQEFKWYEDIIESSEKPVISLIGNHDHRSNGHRIYERMFGPANMTFQCGSYKFILFDDVVWENERVSPKFTWLSDQVANKDSLSILFAHIPPCGDQLYDGYQLAFSKVYAESNIMLSIHGHIHAFCESSFEGIPTVVSGWVKDKNYCIIKLIGNTYDVEYHTFYEDHETVK